MQIYIKRLPVAEYGTHHYPSVPSDHGILGDQIKILRVGVDTHRMLEDDELFKDVVQYWTVYIWEPLKQRFPSCSLCLFATQFLSTTTPTRLDRYWRLWKRLKRNHPELIDLEETFEREFSENQKNRYAGISILKEADFQNALDYGRVIDGGGLFIISNPNTNLEVITVRLLETSFTKPDKRGDSRFNWEFFAVEIASCAGTTVIPTGHWEWGVYYIDTFIPKGSEVEKVLLPTDDSPLQL